MYLSVLNLLFYTTCVQSANILGVFMVPSISHQIVYQPIWRELSLRGHKVTVVTPDPLNDPSLTNLTEISVKFAYEIFQQNKLQEVASKDANVFQSLYAIYRLMDLVAETELNSTKVQNLIHDKNKHFDLILIEYLHPVMYALGGKFKAPVITVSSWGAFTPGYDAIGNPSHPFLYPDVLLSFHNSDLSLWQKIKSVLFSIWTRYHHNYILVPRAQKMAEKYFGHDIPNVGDLERNVSMLFLNVNPIFHSPRPNVPAVIEMGQMHIKPIKPLPKDLQQIMDESKEGIVYFSLGTNVKSVDIPEKIRKNILEALSELPYKVIWKWESDHLPGKPSNVIIRKWLPQQDILAHPNIRVFVTQGGLQSTEEAISRGVPLIGLPFIGDQPMNVQKIVDLGIGIGLNPTTLTKHELKSSIIKVAENSVYKKRIMEVRDLLYDKPMTGLEKAIWWSEYVIRHKGARHLRSPTADLSWFNYLLLDVLLVFIIIISVGVYLSYRLVQFLGMQRKNYKLKYN